MIQARRSATALVLVLVLGSAAPLSAQCLSGDDGFDVGCCIPGIIPNYPVFSGTTMAGSWAELARCVPTHLNTVNVAISTPSPVACDYALINIFVGFPGGETITGQLAAKYVRTFQLFPIGTGQVWRFLVNGDLTCMPNAAAVPCNQPLPRCSFVPGQQVHFDGHLDYRCVPGTTLSGVSLSLTHHSGCLSHAPWSCVPMAPSVLSHGESSFHLVAPAPFNFAAPSAAPQGNMISDSVRPSLLTFIPSFNYVCSSEHKVGPVAAITDVLSGCNPVGCVAVPCAPSTCSAATACYEDVGINFTTCCLGAIWGPFATVPIGGTPIANTGMLAVRLGTWGAVPGGYPSNVSLRAYWGVMNYSPPVPCVPLNATIHCATGVGTHGPGMAAQPFTIVPTCLPPAGISTAFIDLENNLPLSSAPLLTPGYGCLAASDVVWSFNLP